MAYTLKGKLQAIIDGLGTPAGADLAADIAAIKSVVDALDTATLQTLIEAIQGTGFSDVTDSLKVISDNVDIVDGLVDDIKAKTDLLPASPCATADIANALVDVKHKDIGATFDPSTDSLEAIREAIDAGFTLTGDAVVDNVLVAKTFYKDNYQTKLTGTMPNNAGDIAAISASMDGTTIKVVPAEGYTDGVDDTSTIDLTTVDGDLVTDNIKAGANIFGVAGKAEVVDTTEVDNAATAADIADGKVAFVNGVKITGTHV